MFAGNFQDRASFTGRNFAFYESEGVKVAFRGILYGDPTKDEAPDPAKQIAKQYLAEGPASFAALDGAFTLVIWEGEKTLIVRDHHGTDDQVYYNRTHYASSLGELIRTPGYSAQVDPQALSLFLSGGYIPSGQSAFSGVQKLPAGTLLLYDRNGIQTRNLFDVSALEPAPIPSGNDPLESYSETYGILHARAIRRRIRESRKVGILLSGGYDSGCNLAALRQNYDGEIRSYSIGFQGDHWTELPLARCMSETFGTVHHEYEIDGSEIKALPEIVAHLGDPFVEGGLMVNYAAMRMIGEDKPDVILGGDGSDQYFGTSGREIAIHYLARKYGAYPLLDLLHRLLGGASKAGGNIYRMRFHLDKILHILHGDVFGFETQQVKQLLREPAWAASPPPLKPDTRSFEHLYTQHAYQTDVEKIINQVILFKAVQMAALFGNTIAFPYLDRELYDFLKRLPVYYKCKGDSALQIAKGHATAKFLLKYHYAPMLPEAITSKRKQGGFAPMPLFFQHTPQRKRLTEFILESTVVREYLRREAVERFLSAYDRECTHSEKWFWYRQNRAIQAFNLLTLAVWWELYVAGKTTITL